MALIAQKLHILPPRQPSFRPYLIHKMLIQQENKQQISLKRHEKYIHNLDTNSNKILRKRASKLKLLHSINLITYPSKKYLPLLRKIVKPHHKSLRKVQGSLNEPKILKSLPLLSDLNLSPGQNPPRFKVLVSHLAFKRLFFNFASKVFYYGNQPPKTDMFKLLTRYKSALSRILPRMKALEAISLNVSTQDPELLILMMQILDQERFLSSLKGFELILTSYLRAKPKTVRNTEIEDLLFRTTIFENLKSLDLKISPDGESWDFTNLSHLQNFQRLTKLKLFFKAKSITEERKFFENFTLPASIECLDINLRGFILIDESLSDTKWETVHNHFLTIPYYISFFEKLKNYTNITSFSITEDSLTRPDVAVVFASLITRQFTQLKKASYKRDPHPFSMAKSAKSGDLNFVDFLKDLYPSVDTLETIELSSELLAVSFDGALETLFPRLKNLTLNSKVHWTPEFHQRLANLEKLNVKRVFFNDEKYLRGFFGDFRKISCEMNVILDVDLQGIQEEFVTNCMKEYLQEVNIQGNLQMRFENIEIKDVQAFTDILEMALENGCFQELEMRFTSLKIQVGIWRQKVIEFLGNSSVLNNNPRLEKILMKRAEKKILIYMRIGD